MTKKENMKGIDNIIEIQENYYHSELQYSGSGKLMELDIFLPKEKIAFEYQGEHHYYDIYSLGSGWNQKEKDKEKRRICKEKEITLIEIPYWWDKQIQSLASTIHKERNDLLTLYHTDNNIQPIISIQQQQLEGNGNILILLIIL